MIVCLRYKHMGKGSLLGFADIFVEKWGLEIYNLSIFQKDGARWVNFPSREYTDAEGKKKFASYLRLNDKEKYDAFCEATKTAIDKWCKENATEERNPVTAQQPTSYADLPF